MAGAKFGRGTSNLAKAGYTISLNQLAEFSGSTDTRKRKIVENQRIPPQYIVPLYRRARFAIRKSLELGGSLSPVTRALKLLKDTKTETNWQERNKKLSVEALELYRRLRIPGNITGTQLEVVKAGVKSLLLEDVEVIVAPDVVFKVGAGTRAQYGAIKIHLSKGNSFDLTRSRFAASIIHKYLIEVGLGTKETVRNDLCYSLDVFGNRMVSAPENSDELIERLGFLCKEVKRIWDRL